MSQDETSRSGPHRRVERILDQMAITYESEREFRPYSVDIYLPEWHLGIEIDGPSHSATRDAKRDDFLMSKCHLPIMRIKAAGMDVNVIKKAVEEFIGDWYADSSQRKRAYTEETP